MNDTLQSDSVEAAENGFFKAVFCLASSAQSSTTTTGRPSCRRSGFRSWCSVSARSWTWSTSCPHGPALLNHRGPILDQRRAAKMSLLEQSTALWLDFSPTEYSLIHSFVHDFLFSIFRIFRHLLLKRLVIVFHVFSILRQHSLAQLFLPRPTPCK